MGQKTFNNHDFSLYTTLYSGHFVQHGVRHGQKSAKANTNRRSVTKIYFFGGGATIAVKIKLIKSNINYEF